jgi:hypothetical protein
MSGPESGLQRRDLAGAGFLKWVELQQVEGIKKYFFDLSLA